MMAAFRCRTSAAVIYASYASPPQAGDAVVIGILNVLRLVKMADKGRQIIPQRADPGEIAAVELYNRESSSESRLGHYYESNHPKLRGDKSLRAGRLRRSI